MHLFSALSPDICKTVDKTQINCLIGKRKIIFPAERIHFNAAWTLYTSSRYIRLVPLLTKKPIKCQVHKHTPAVSAPPTGAEDSYPCAAWWAVTLGLQAQQCVAIAATPVPQRSSSRRVRDEGRTAGQPALPYQVTKQWAHQRGCSQAAWLPPPLPPPPPSEIQALLLAAKCEQNFHPKLIAGTTFHTHCKNTHSFCDCFYRSLILCTFQIHSEYLSYKATNGHYHKIIEYFGLEGTFKGRLVQPPLQWVGTSSTRSGCSEPRPTWPWMFPGMGHLPPLWATWSSVSPPSW